MQIRLENEEDIEAVQAVNESAFETSEEARLVAALRKQAQPVISMVAEDDGKIIGHIMFSPVTLEGHYDLKIMGLAPMSVMPERQRQGIGSALVHEGLEKCKKLGFGAVVVLGHPDYYPRFGFLPTKLFGIKSDYDVPEDVFMVKELQPGYLDDARGTIMYHDVFSKV